MKFIRKHLMPILFFLGLALRFGLMFLDFSFDVNNHQIWAKDAVERGFAGFYELQSSAVFGTLYPNYPPFAIYLFYPIFAFDLKQFFYDIVWRINLAIPFFPSKWMFFLETRTFAMCLYKIPGIFADMGLAWITFLLARKSVPQRKSAHILATSLILFNPLIFYNSAYWGQIDTIPLFFIAASLYALLILKKSTLSAVTFTIALLVKPTPVVFIPLYLFLYLRMFSLKKLAIDGVISLTIFWISFIPFYKTGSIITFPFYIYWEKLLSGQSISSVTNAAFNGWSINTALHQVKDTELLLGLTYRLWGYILTGICYSAILFILYKRKIELRSSIFSFFLIALCSFLFLTRIHERHLILTVPFFVLMTIGDKNLWKWFLLLTVTGFLNLYHSWPVPLVRPLIDMLSDKRVISVLSFIHLSIGIYLIVYFLRTAQIGLAKKIK